MKPKANIVHLPVYQPGKPIEEVKREFGLDKVVKLASNENPYGCSPKAKEAIIRELDNTQIYPDGASAELTRALAARLGVEPSQIIFGAGSDEVILMIARAFLVPGDETVMASHTFPQYKHNAEIEGVRVVEVPLKDGRHDLPAMLAAVNGRTKIVWICNPNNPTGTHVSHEEVDAFMAGVPSTCLVVLDEAYVEYKVTADFPDSLALLRKYPNMIVLRTFSKIYGLASLRIGYGIGRAEVIHNVNQVREPFNTTRFAQAAALAALEDQAFIETCAARNKEGIEWLNEQFKRLGLDAFPTSGNFIMVHVKRPAKEVFEALLRRGVIVRGGHSLGFPTSLRVTVGRPEENETFIRTLEQVFAEIEPVAASARD